MLTSLTFRKILANFIDLFISLFIRLSSIMIILFIFKESIESQLKILTKLENITTRSEALEILSNHQLPQTIMILIIIFILSGSFYYIYFRSSSWCATIGQRIFNIVFIKDNSEYITFPTVISHYILSTIPFFVTIYFIFYILLKQIIIKGASDIISIFTANNFNIFLTILMILWVNIPLFIKNKKSLADIICKTKIEIGKTDSKFPKIRL